MRAKLFIAVSGLLTLPAYAAELDIIDLPGVYSLTPRSEDEQVTHDVLMGRMPGVPKPDTILLILDVTNLGRHLVLAAPILALGLPTLVVLNMADELEKRGGDVEAEALAQRLGAPVALISAASGVVTGREGGRIPLCSAPRTFKSPATPAAVIRWPRLDLSEPIGSVSVPPKMRAALCSSVASPTGVPVA